MAPELLFDLSSIDQDKPQYSVEDVERCNPHRGHMRMIDGVIWANEGFSEGLGYKDVRDDEFWVAGHIPGRPLFPGVLMVEMIAQLASFMHFNRMSHSKFMGFTAIDQVKFRGQVVPGDRLLMLVKEVSFRPRRFICAGQGLINGKLVFEGQITGMPI